MRPRKSQKAWLTRNEIIFIFIIAFEALCILFLGLGDRAHPTTVMLVGIACLLCCASYIIGSLPRRTMGQKIHRLVDYFKRTTMDNGAFETLFTDKKDEGLVSLNFYYNKALENRLYKELFNNAPIAIYRSCLDGKLISHNKCFADLLGYDYDQGTLCLHQASSLYADPADREVFLEKLLEKGSICNERLCLRKQQGNLIWVTVNAILLRNPGDSTLYIDGFLTDINYLIQEHDELLSLAETDPLTGIANRRAFMHKLEKACSYARGHASMSYEDSSASVSVLMIDLDNFKPINDQFGHDAGDEVLRAVARIGKATMRKGDVFARLGGDEFIMLIPKTGITEARNLAERFAKGVAELPQYAIDRSITVSVGIASRSGMEVSVEMLLRESDSAMYNAKQAGRNRICSFS